LHANARVYKFEKLQMGSKTNLTLINIIQKTISQKENIIQKPACEVVTKKDDTEIQIFSTTKQNFLRILRQGKAPAKSTQNPKLAAFHLGR